MKRPGFKELTTIEEGSEAFRRKLYYTGLGREEGSEVSLQAFAGRPC